MKWRPARAASARISEIALDAKKLILRLLCYPKPRPLSEEQILDLVHHLGIEGADDAFVEAIEDLQRLPAEHPQRILLKDGRFTCKCKT